MIEQQTTAVVPAPPVPLSLETAAREALIAVERARDVLRAHGDPLAAAVDSAVTCAATLMVLRASGPTRDVDAVRDALGAARALVVEVTFALRDLQPNHQPTRTDRHGAG
jgi:predicted NBD/HSP70 family sugar kinase